MSQRKAILKLWLFLFSLMLFLLLTGCITLAVNQFIQHPQISMEGMFFSPTNKQFTSGVYLGRSTVKGLSYARIEVKSVVEGCKEGHPAIELLLPMEKNTDAKVTTRSGFSSKELLFVKDEYVGQPVKIIFYSPSKDKEINIDKDMALMMSSYNWSGYPSVVIIGFIEGGIKSFAYRIAPEADDFMVCHFHNYELVGAYTCTKDADNYAGIILKPFAIDLDIITFPIQFLFVLGILILGDMMRSWGGKLILSIYLILATIGTVKYVRSELFKNWRIRKDPAKQRRDNEMKKRSIYWWIFVISGLIWAVCGGIITGMALYQKSNFLGGFDLVFVTIALLGSGVFHVTLVIWLVHKFIKWIDKRKNFAEKEI